MLNKHKYNAIENKSNKQTFMVNIFHSMKQYEFINFYVCQVRMEKEEEKKQEQNSRQNIRFPLVAV